MQCSIFATMQFSIFATMQCFIFCNMTILYFCNITILNFCNITILYFSSNSILYFCNIAILYLCYNAILYFLQHVNTLSLQQCNALFSQQCNALFYAILQCSIFCNNALLYFLQQFNSENLKLCNSVLDSSIFFASTGKNILFSNIPLQQLQKKECTLNTFYCSALRSLNQKCWWLQINHEDYTKKNCSWYHNDAFLILNKQINLKLKGDLSIEANQAKAFAQFNAIF